uniref:Putative 15-hydroxyprostaglandin dehydrogenase n=1 Tax=Nyssomyia neivai TaxID=330878 RepID=A0A1L8DZC4_9DIPT
MSVADKIVLVTGACSGIGRALCDELLKNSIKGLLAWDLHSSEPESVAKWKKDYPKISIKYMNVDVSIPEKVKLAYESVSSIDIVINCAGILDESEFKKTIDINLGGVVASTLSALELMRKDKGGNGGIIVNIASVVGIHAASFLPTYSATKHGVIAFHRSLAHEHESLGIKFICICPGFTTTSLYDNNTKDGFYFMYNKEKQTEVRKLFKPQTADVIAAGLVKLLNDGINGSVWIIEGGEWKEEVYPKLRY